MKDREIFLDIGAGLGENFIRRAQANPEKEFIIIEPYERNIPKERPENLTWIAAGIDERYHLSFKDNSIDEVNLDFVLIFLHGFDRESLFPKFLSEAVRVLKRGGKIFIREPHYMLEFLEPIFDSLNLNFSIRPIPIQNAKMHSESVREMALNYEVGDKTMQPYLIEIIKARS